MMGHTCLGGTGGMLSGLWGETQQTGKLGGPTVWPQIRRELGIQETEKGIYFLRGKTDISSNAGES